MSFPFPAVVFMWAGAISAFIQHGFPGRLTHDWYIVEYTQKSACWMNEFVNADATVGTQRRVQLKKTSESGGLEPDLEDEPDSSGGWPQTPSNT